MKLRYGVPVLAILALTALFFRLPETPDLFGLLGCKKCISSDPYLPLLGAGYFSALIAISLLFPSFPSSLIARAGLTWAILLTFALTYMHFPAWCPICLIGHSCNILIWMIWVLAAKIESEQPNSPPSSLSGSPIKVRVCVTLFAPIAVVALFSCINLTFMAYGFKPKFVVSGLQSGNEVPTFTLKTAEGRILTHSDLSGKVINFIAPDCPYCKEQLQILNDVAQQLDSGASRFIHVTSKVSLELFDYLPTSDWIEDNEGKLRELFKVSGYPTLFVVGNEGKIELAISGVPKQLKTKLLANLAYTGYTSPSYFQEKEEGEKKERYRYGRAGS